MPTPQDKLAQSLAVLQVLQDKGIIAIHTKKNTRTHRERLLKNGVIKEVIKGWYTQRRKQADCSSVYIRMSKHVPPRYEAVRDLMPAFFTLLKDEKEPAVRAVLGHFLFVYIHPYIDGNRRIGRFLMNVMLSSCGYPWTVIPLETRNEYMATLEEASVGKNIEPFSRFLAKLVQKEMDNKL